MRYKVLCCEVFTRELKELSGKVEHELDIEYLPKGLHDLGQEKMLARMQEAVDAASGRGFGAILLVYGLCNNGINGLVARDTPVVVPRAHDCITLFMGGREIYAREFEARPGTYYRTTGWIEHESSEGAGDETIQQKLGLFMKYEELVEKYGEDNARYIQETMGSGVQHYDRLGFIKMGVEGESEFQEKARQEALDKGWAFEVIEGSMRILLKLVSAQWDEDFLVLEPGHAVRACYTDAVIESVQKP